MKNPWYSLLNLTSKIEIIKFIFFLSIFIYNIENRLGWLQFTFFRLPSEINPHFRHAASNLSRGIIPAVMIHGNLNPVCRRQPPKKKWNMSKVGKEAVWNWHVSCLCSRLPPPNLVFCDPIPLPPLLMTSHSGNGLSKKCLGDLEKIPSLSRGPGLRRISSFTMGLYRG